MNTLLLSGLLLLALLVLVIFWSRGRAAKHLPYEMKETLFSPAERSFLGVLDLAVGDKARIFAKVRVADVLTPQAEIGKSKWQQYFNKISAKHFDYLLCHPTDLSFICAIELDDSSHRHQKRKARDLFLKTACYSAGLPLLQIPASTSYLVEELREQIQPLLDPPREPQGGELLPGERREPTFNPLLLDGVDVGRSSHGRPGSAATSQATTWGLSGANITKSEVRAPQSMEGVDGLFAEIEDEEQAHEVHHCPRCDAPLVEREAKKGPHAGRIFLACSRFPECRYAAPHPHTHS